jgi:serine/threonine protein kinase/Tol biopolymer transport system component
LIGSTLSHYRIIDRLGGGGMGVVYKALDLKLDRPVALKFLAGQRGGSEEHKRRFLREARAASALDHPNVCTVYEIDETADGALFIVMAYCEGETLRARLDRGPLPIGEAVGIARQIAAGLARAHERGIIHRDVKPGNAMLTPGGPAGGTVKLVDFGIAKLADQSRLTRTGKAVGTAAYMSPEQFHGEPADPRIDVWSLGVVLYEMVTGHLPFEAADEKLMVRAILGRAPLPMTALRPGVPPALERVVERALAKAPADRYARIEAMRSDLADVAETLAPSPLPDAGSTLFDLPVLAPYLAEAPASPSAAASASPSQDAGAGLLGQTVGPYEILEVLGGGGMGVIYKARDPRLDRVVALKFLPPELTRDAEAKARFVQEARAASSLDHPNLCTILELGETPDGRLYLAMPCYDGETLRRRIERGPLAVEAALDIATQIAAGLAKAHRNGIVHRDIKPPNVIVTADGVVKILDFGLAKLAGSAAISAAGSSLGTPAYMSPEQARGDTVDPRTDLWSLGIVCYEMLAGQRPFRGERAQTVIYAILNERPQPLREVRPEIPEEVARIVDRLLAKPRAARYANVEEALADLRALRGEGATGITRTLTMPLGQGSSRGRRAWLWGATAALLSAAGLGLYLLPRAGRGAAPVQATFTRLTDPGSATFPSLAPDGGTFVYVRATRPGRLDIYRQRVGEGSAVNLTARLPASATQPAWSPDGTTLAFRSEQGSGGIYLMALAPDDRGGAVRPVADFGFNPAWSPDGTELLVATEGVSDPRVRKIRSEVWRVDEAGNRRRLIAGDAVQPSWSPHGRRIAYWGIPAGSADRAIWTQAAAGGEPVLVLRDRYLNWSPVWSPDGEYLYFASDRGGSMNLWRLPIDEGSGEVLGRPEAITAPSEWNGLPSLSRDGKRILFAISEKRADLASVPLAAATLAAGRPTPVMPGSRGIRSCDVSPDGKQVAFHSSIPQEDLFVMGTDGGTARPLRQLTHDVARDRYPRWSADGARLVFQSNRGGRSAVWSVRADGAGLEPVAGTSQGSLSYPFESPDGRWLAFNDATRGPALLDLRLPPARRRSQPLPPVTADGQTFYAVSWSPDGRWLAGDAETRDARTLPGIVLYSPATRSYTRLSSRGEAPRWLPGGRTLLALDQGGIIAVDVAGGSIRPVLAPETGSTPIAFCVSPDGRTLFVSRGSEEGAIGMLSLQ